MNSAKQFKFVEEVVKLPNLSNSINNALRSTSQNPERKMLLEAQS